jgi:hypothetical protein
MAAALVAGLLWWDLRSGEAGRWVERRMALAAFGALFALGAYGLMWGSRRPERWALLSVAAGVGYLLLGYFALGAEPRVRAWGYVAEGVALLYAVLSVPVMVRREKMEEAFAAYATCAVVALGCAPPMVWERAELTAFWSALVPLAGWLGVRLRVRGLWTVAGLVAAVVTSRLAANPAVLLYGTGPSVWWNPVVWGYVPTMGMLVAAMFLVERGAKGTEQEAGARELGGWLEVAASVVGLAFVTMAVRRGFHAESLAEGSVGLAERATYPSVWLAAGLGVVGIGWKWGPAVERAVGYGALVVAAGYLVLVQILGFNPLWWGDNVGEHVVVNWLLYMYGLPGVLLGAGGGWVAGRG